MPSLDLNKIVEALQSVLPEDGKPVALHEPFFDGNEWTYVKECLDTGWVSSVGKFVDKFEKMLVDFTGVKHAVAVVNGTAALHICLKLLDVNPGDEVLVPALTFVATANAVVYCGAIPHFVDSEEKTLGLAPGKLSEYLDNISVVRKNGCFNKKTGRRIKAVMPMHTFGHPVDLDPLIEICSRYKLELLEDAAESIGSYYRGRHTGNLGKVAALSFNGNKTITTGGGGAILTNDEELGKLAKHLTTTARVPHKWAILHDRLGYNYRLPNINAALGCAQMEKLPEFLINKRNLAENYRNAFEGLDGIHFFTEPEFASSNYWLNTLLLDEDNSDQLDVLLEMTNSLGNYDPARLDAYAQVSYVQGLSQDEFERCRKHKGEADQHPQQRSIMKEKIILIGGGGHCKACIDVIEQEGSYQIAGIVDLPEMLHQKVLGYEVIATDKDLPQLAKEYKYFFIALGQVESAAKRIEVFNKLTASSAIFPRIISPLAYVSRHSKIDTGTIIMHHALVNAGAEIRSNCIINSKALIEHDAVIEDHCHISTGAIINGGVRVCSGTFVGSNSVSREYIEIGQDSVIGCAARVLKNVPSGSMIK